MNILKLGAAVTLALFLTAATAAAAEMLSGEQIL